MSAEREENAYTLGVQAGLWGYPLVHRVEAFPQTLVVKGIGHNSFRKFDRLKTAEDRFVVTPNNLTVDAYAIIDLADGPVVLHVPKLNTDRWFIVQIGDAFDDVVLNIGGSRPPVSGPYLITGPDYQGSVPGDMTQVASRTTIGFAAVRIAVTGSADLAGAVEAQRGFTMRPLPDYLKHGIAGAEVDYSPSPSPNSVHRTTLATSTVSGRRCAICCPPTPTSTTPSCGRSARSDSAFVRVSIGKRWTSRRLLDCGVPHR